jgi:hypothetical protein
MIASQYDTELFSYFPILQRPAHALLAKACMSVTILLRLDTASTRPTFGNTSRASCAAQESGLA